MNDVSEAEWRRWSDRLKESDEGAARALFKAAYPHLFRYTRRITRDGGAAEDVVQETFLRLWRMRERLDPDRSVRALLFVMARNLAYDRHSTRTTALGDAGARSTAQPDPSESVDARMLADRLQGWIDALPARRREAFHLSRFEDLSYEEIARVMDISVRTVENHIRHALQDLRDRIRDYEPTLLEG